MGEYESWMQKALSVGAAGGVNSDLASPMALIEMMGIGNLLGGDAAALFAYSTMAQLSHKRASSGTQADATLGMMGSGHGVARLVTGARIPFPAFSEEERKSFLGSSISHVVSLFYSKAQYIMSQREARKKEGSEVASEKFDGAASESDLPHPRQESGVTNYNEIDTRIEAEFLETLDREKADQSAQTFDSGDTAPVVKR